ncbi:hypothetical protein B9G55_01440 [Saccharibacillus sp. O16]|nr:hypothetical protein B9G55_01440 [Saccharibacillus sp. O16]
MSENLKEETMGTANDGKGGKAEQRRQTTPPAPTVENKEPEHLIYIGPTLTGGLEEHALFIEGIPVRVAKRFEELPELKELFIPVTDFPAGRIDIQTPGTEFYAALQSLKQKGVV